MEGLSIIQALREVANYIEYEDGRKITASQLLELFLFDKSRHRQKVQALSGGERRRLDIILILMTNPNFLILDEPTNDLDLQTLNVLEEYLLQFSGCFILVSHDRYFLDKLSDMTFVFSAGRPIEVFPGICSDYIFETAPKKNIKTPKAMGQDVGQDVEPTKTSKAKTKLSYKDRLRREAIVQQIPNLEKNLERLEKQLSSGETDAKKLEEWSHDYNQTENQLFSLLSELESIEGTLTG